ncbi:MAG: ABC transporter permease, partial [Candidatus Aminicenantes bacterium]|nr:ABC transporter permease [Candidatus Aminicenantes bacterium]
MIRNFLFTAIRNFKKARLISLINMLGLSLGLAAFLLLTMYVKFERSYDRFQPDSGQIYRLRYERTDQAGQSVRFASCCPPAGARIRTLYPEVEKVARLFRYRGTVSFEDKAFIEERMYFAEPDLMAIFAFPFLEGDPLEGIRSAQRAFISESTARKYFSREDPVGKTFRLDRKMDFQVAGVFSDIRPDSHLKFDLLLSYPDIHRLYGEEIENSWGDSGWFTYLRLAPGADPAALEQKLPALVEAEFGEALRAYKLTCRLVLQPLLDIHLNSNFQQEIEANGDRDAVGILSFIALFILLIAWANYINLSTARSLTRAREVGLRKVIGASRFQVAVQFFLETLLVNLAAVIGALILIASVLPSFIRLNGLPAGYSPWSQPWFWPMLAVLFAAGMIGSGAYPMIILSSFHPAAVLRGKLGSGRRGLNLRKAIVVFQFICAFGLGIGTTAVIRQVAFMKNVDPGFSLDRKIVLRAPRVRDESFSRRLPAFKDELLRKTGVNGICVTTDVPGRQAWWDAGAIRRAGTDDNKNYQIVGIDEDFVDVFGLAAAAGRNFSREHPGDASSLLVNETAARWLGFSSPREAIGQPVDYWGKIFTVIGVLKDYHQQSPKQAFEPHIFRYLPEGRDVRGWFVLNAEEEALPALLPQLRKLYDEFFPGNAFDHFFL